MFNPKLLLIIVITIATTLFISPQTYAQVSGQPDELQAIYACKSISSPQERLSCYDNSVGRFQAAEKSGDVVTVSKAAIENVERDAFGFNLPSLPSLGGLFGGSKSSKPKSAKTKSNDLTDPVKQAIVTPRPQSPTKSSTIISKPKVSDINKVNLDIRKTTEFGHKKTRFFMTNGQVWEQVDGIKIRVPKVRNNQANTAAISKASLGSFFLRINGKGSAIRVRRVR